MLAQKVLNLCDLFSFGELRTPNSELRKKSGIGVIFPANVIKKSSNLQCFCFFGCVFIIKGRVELFLIKSTDKIWVCFDFFYWCSYCDVMP